MTPSLMVRLLNSGNNRQLSRAAGRTIEVQRRMRHATNKKKNLHEAEGWKCGVCERV